MHNDYTHGTYKNSYSFIFYIPVRVKGHFKQNEMKSGKKKSSEFKDFSFQITFS